MSIPLSAAEAAASILVARRVSGEQGAGLPAACCPSDIEAALAIQAAVSEQWCLSQDDSIGAWKCLQPPQDKLIIGPIYTSTINTVAPIALWPKGELARIEPELTFIFGQDLSPRPEPYTPAEVDAAIARTHMALELINSRYADTAERSFPEMLADGLVNQGLFIGPQVESEKARQASEIALRIEYPNGEVTEHQGVHPNTHPRAPLYWLAEFLRSRGQGIQAGQAVITGSYAGVLEVPLNTDLKIHYQGLGVMEVSFTAKS